MLQGNVGEKFTAHVNLALMRKAEQLPGLDLLEDSRFHDDLNLLREGAKNRPINFLVLIVSSVRDVITLIGLAGVLTAVGWWVPLVVLISAYPQARMTLKLREVGWDALLSRTPEARAMEYEAQIALSHQHAAEVRLYHLVPWLSARYQKAFDASHATMRRVRVQQAFQVLPASFLSVFLAGGLFAWTVLRTARGELLVGEIVVIVTGLGQVQQQVFSLIENTGWLFERGLYFQNYFSFLRAVPGVRYPTQPQELPARTPIIAFEGVSFHYPDGRAALQDVSFSIQPGETIAVVGENGAGKSTLIKLLLRYYDASQGRVTLSGTDIRNVELDAWRSRIGAIFQDFGRYAYTVRENITLAWQGQNDEARLRGSAEHSGWAQVMDRLEGGLETRLGKEFGGTELSGGQWQKLALARAQGRTTILVTHRLGSVLMADRILVMKKGRLVEQGSHGELLTQGGEYAELWRMQAGQYEHSAAD